MREMWDLIRAAGWRRTLADLFTFAALCAMLYALVVISSGMVE